MNKSGFGNHGNHASDRTDNEREVTLARSVRGQKLQVQRNVALAGYRV